MFFPSVLRLFWYIVGVVGYCRDPNRPQQFNSLDQGSQSSFSAAALWYEVWASRLGGFRDGRCATHLEPRRQVHFALPRKSTPKYMDPVHLTDPSLRWVILSRSRWPPLYMTMSLHERTCTISTSWSPRTKLGQVRKSLLACVAIGSNQQYQRERGREEEEEEENKKKESAWNSTSWSPRTKLGQVRKSLLACVAIGSNQQYQRERGREEEEEEEEEENKKKESAWKRTNGIGPVKIVKIAGGGGGGGGGVMSMLRGTTNGRSLHHPKRSCFRHDQTE